ncbi:MAG: OmpA family protein [Bacteroidetes bacterium]|nr:OmpA family protein [Bacteroidota bacterium]MDA1119141.1 OmpA family protein [Bacteroidota bacterium]
MGGGLNSTSDDVYFNIPSTGKHAYFTRGALNENTDIFRFEIEDLYGKPVVAVTIRGRVLNAKTNEPMGAVSIVIDEESNTADVGDLTSGASGEYAIDLNPGLEYGLLASRSGYTGQKEVVNIPTDTESTEITKDLYLVPDLPKSIVTVLFDFDKADLVETYQKELKDVLSYFGTGAIDVLQIDGHTDSKGSEAYNLKLSEKRANTVRDFFTENGISTDKLKVIPHGELDPAVPNDSDENRSKNRRVEFSIIDMSAN